MNRSSQQFDPESFLQPFEGREYLLQEYIDSIPPTAVSIGQHTVTAASLMNHLELCPQEEYRVITSGFVEAWELCSDEAHENLLAICRLEGICTPQIRSLPAECLALHLLTTNRGVFEAAISMDEVKKSDSLTLFKPTIPVHLAPDLNIATNNFRTHMAASCGEKYGSRRVLLKRFDKDGILTVGFYFEKSPKTIRVLAGDDATPNLARAELRPIQMDFLLFDRATGVLSIRSSWSRLTDQIRQSFAAAFLTAPEAYEGPDAVNILQLDHLVDLNDEPTDLDGEHIFVSEVGYSLPNVPLDADYTIKGKRGTNVRDILRRDGAAHRIQGGVLRRVVTKMALASSSRRMRVVLIAPNKVEFKRTAEANRILAQLANWEVFHAPVSSQIAA
ncbi:MAG: hypothetical protein K9N47_25280 [Prosthecobacter sp.]|uniref:hypothetical protein n=1 Tax=Prosthecobacter sp. TaxID=1965333 RepID=UPI002612BFDE|nr:hypothetical protein [Prosthecobacter sp.]MCF7789460.1 hypothetical protein [Prosthecobacter sp.]